MCRPDWHSVHAEIQPHHTDSRSPPCHSGHKPYPCGHKDVPNVIDAQVKPQKPWGWRGVSKCELWLVPATNRMLSQSLGLPCKFSPAGKHFGPQTGQTHIQPEAQELVFFSGGWELACSFEISGRCKAGGSHLSFSAFEMFAVCKGAFAVRLRLCQRQQTPKSYSAPRSQLGILGCILMWPCWGSPGQGKWP